MRALPKVELVDVLIPGEVAQVNQPGVQLQAEAELGTNFGTQMQWNDVYTVSNGKWLPMTSTPG
jgi:hypothetical protein